MLVEEFRVDASQNPSFFETAFALLCDVVFATAGNWARAKLSVHPVAMLARSVQRLLPASILVVAIVSAPVMILSPEGLPRVQSLERELAGVRQENEDARRQIAFLRKTVENLKDNPTAVERLARDELGLTRKNEVVFQFPRQK